MNTYETINNHGFANYHQRIFFTFPLMRVLTILINLYHGSSLVHSRFPTTRFLPTSVPLYERVTVPYNEQLINPSSPTTMG